MSKAPHPALLVVFVLPLAIAFRGTVDRDGDGIPDPADPFPDDRDRPGRAEPNTVYANTSTTLFAISPDGRDIRGIADFTFSDGTGRMVTDLAIDRFGVMWAVSFDALHVCHPKTARCEVLSTMSRSFNALAVLDVESEPGGQTLVAATTDGNVHLIRRDGTLLRTGSLGGPSSGDIMVRSGIVLAARDEPQGDTLVTLDAASGNVKDVIAALPGAHTYGLATCAQIALALDEGGELHHLDAAGKATFVRDTEVAWWGAACSPETYAPKPSEGDLAPESDDPAPGSDKPTPLPYSPPDPPVPSGCLGF
jgi:hypothetical protein